MRKEVLFVADGGKEKEDTWSKGANTIGEALG